MNLRRTAVAWTLGSILILAIACGSAASGDGDIAQSNASAAPAASTGAFVANAGPTDSGESPVWLGADTVTVSETLAQLLGLTAGERVAWVTPGGPAGDLLILGDTIVAVDGAAVDGASGGLAAAIATRTEGEAVTLSIVRGGENLDVAVTLAARPVHESAGSLAEIEGLFDRALSAEVRFLDREGGEHSAGFVSGTLSGVNAGRVTLSRPGSGPMTVALSPNVFVWIDGAPGTVQDLADETGSGAKVVTLDDVAIAALAGGIVPPIFEALEELFGPEGLFGPAGSEVPGALGGSGMLLETLKGLFGVVGAPDSDAGR